jgi:hypothetical protein
MSQTPQYTAIPSLRTLSDYDGAFDRAFSLLAFIANRHLIDHMLRAARLLVDGDFEALIVWGVLAHQNVAHLMPPGSVPNAVLNDIGHIEGVADRLRPMLLRDLAAITGIPRETVRRKLARLVTQGYVERDGRAWVVSLSRLEPDLREHSRETVWRLVAAADEVMTALRSADTSAPPRSPAARAIRPG